MRRLVGQARRLAAFGLTAALLVPGHAGAPLPIIKQVVALEPEALLVRGLLDIQRNQLDDALREIDGALKLTPNFRLAQLIRGDLLLARSRPITKVGEAPGVSEDAVEDLRQEARVRLERYREAPPSGLVPRNLLQLSASQDYVYVADLSRHRLFVFANEPAGPRRIADYYISTGKFGSDKRREGDKKTPIGVYFVTDSLAPSRLTDFYGTGAFPINYPNEWDRREGRSGYGIWIHGVPSDTYSRPPRASDGCLALTNQDLSALSRTVQVGRTPVIITPRIDWAPPSVVREESDSLAAQIEAWRRDWESLDTERYLAHYSPTFRAGNKDFEDWAKRKRQINASKQWVKVGVSNLSLFLYGGRDDLAVATFDQEYTSSNLTDRESKRQYWVREDGLWKIAYEGSL